MRIDRDKLLKMGLALLAILLFVACSRFLLQRNSITLSEYAAQDPERNKPVDPDNMTGGSGSDNSFTETDASGSNNDNSSNGAGVSDNNNSDPSNETDGSGGNNDNSSTESNEADASGSDNANSSNESNEADSSGSDSESEPNETRPDASSLVGASLNGTSQEEYRTTYAPSFYYEPLSDNLRRYMTGISYPDVQNTTENDKKLAISLDELSYIHILHYDFDGNLAEGELICHQTIAQDLIEIFYELYENEYRLEKVHLIDEYDGDDTASMEDNNTSCFNYRTVENSTHLSKHAYGLALDINPFYNPYVTFEKGVAKVSPAAAEAYADRSAVFPYKIDENDLCYKLFRKHGFTWGGNWNSSKDYQHFQKTLP